MKFPNVNVLREFTRKFYNVAEFPDVVGCIDCTHIPIKSPGGQIPEVYRNRKGWMSLNVQVVCGPNSEILDIVARWPGSTHDSRIFQNSGVMVAFEEHRINGILLGDNGYAQSRYVYTPIVNPNTEIERRYNRAHVKTRNIIERTFGMWKRKFGCLQRKLFNSLNTTTKIIVACAILHNIAVTNNEWVVEVENAEENNNEDVPNLVVQDVARGNIIRAAFIERHFR